MTSKPGTEPEPPAAAAVAARPRPPLFTANLLLLCTAVFFMMFSFQLLIPVMPLYLLSIGGSDSQVGLLLGATAGAALLMRPLTGWVADRRGRKPLMVAGALDYLVASAFYPLARSLGPLLGVRALQGAGLSAIGTGGSAYMADLAPPERRAEGMGVYGVAVNVASAIAPLLGATLALGVGFNAVFLVSGVAAAIGFAVTLRLPERRPAVRAGAARPGFQLVSREALYPAAIAVSLTPAIGVVIAYVPVLSDEQAIANPGLFFLPYSLTLIVVRVLSGRLADRFGREVVLLPALGALVVALLLIASATNVPLLLFGAVVFGVGFGTAHPIVLAMAVDRASPGTEGAALGTLIGAFDIGVGGGAALAGLLVPVAGLRGIFVIASLGPLLGCLGLLAARSRTGHRR